MVEAIIVLPVLLLFLLGIIQFGLVAHGRGNLHYAALMGARAGAVANASVDAIREGIAIGLMPLYNPQVRGVENALQMARAYVACFARIEILNPTAAAIRDFELDPLNPELPNSWLSRRPTEPGAVSGLSIQDANLLKIRVSFAQDLAVPFANAAIPAAVLLAAGGDMDAVERGWLEAGRLPVTMTSIVRMQSPARLGPVAAAPAVAAGCA